MFLTPVSTDLCGLLALVPPFGNLRYFNIKLNLELRGHCRVNLVVSVHGSNSVTRLVKITFPDGSLGPSEVIGSMPYLQKCTNIYY